MIGRAILGAAALAAANAAMADGAPYPDCLPIAVAKDPATMPSELYAHGHFIAAAQRAGVGDDAPTLALAARAILAAVIAAPDAVEIPAALDLGEKFARAAFQADSTHLEAALQLVAVLGAKGRRMDPLAAHLAGHAGEARDLLDDVLARAPDEPWAVLFSGLWHLEAVRRGGSGLARRFYGADQETGRMLVREAALLAPNDPSLLVQGGRGLRAFEDTRAEGDAMIVQAAKLQPRDALEAVMVAWAREGARGEPTVAYGKLCGLLQYRAQR